MAGDSLAAQWLGLGALTAEGPGLIPGLGAKIPQATRYSQKNEEKRWQLLSPSVKSHRSFF